MVALQVHDDSGGDLVTESFHLPGGHNQKSHGNRVGKAGNVPTKKSGGAAKVAPESTPKSSAPTHTEGMNFSDFIKRAKKAKRGRKALLSIPHNSEWGMMDHQDSKTGRLNGYNTFDIFEATRNYQKTSYRSINRELRGKGGDLTDVPPMQADEIKKIDAALSTSPSDSEIYVSRGVTNPSVTFGSAWNAQGSNAGLTWRDDGYTSTTVKDDVSMAFGNQISKEEPVVLHILVPKGTRGIGLDFKVSNAMSGEGEILLDRGLKFRVVHDSGPLERGALVRNLYIEVVPD